MNGPDVIVAGAGPAGTAAALTLARGGARVVVLDRARFPRDKCCGDGLTAGALRRLESLGLEPASIRSWTRVTDIGLRSPSGRSVRAALPPDGLHAVVAPRMELDAALVDLVRRQPGIDLMEGDGLVGVDAGPEGVTVTDASGALHEAPFLVAADGAWSPTRKALAERAGVGARAGAPARAGSADGPAVGTRAYLGEWHAMRQYLTGTGPEAQRRLWVWFEPDLLPAYAWSFPLGGGRVNFGISMVRRPGWRAGAMAPTWAAIIHRPHIRSVLGSDAVPEGQMKAWPIPAAPMPGAGDGFGFLADTGGRVLFTGDAARVADPMTGEGIGQALETGAAAARAILEALSEPPRREVGGAGAGTAAGSDVAADVSAASGSGAAAGSGAAVTRAASVYQRSVSAGLGVDNRLAAALSRVLAHPVGARGAVAIAGRSEWTRSNFARWMFEDYPRAVLVTPRRWARPLLSPRGAYDTSTS